MIRFLLGIIWPGLHDWPHYDRHGNCRCNELCCTSVKRRPILRGTEIVRVMTIKRTCGGKHRIPATYNPNVKPMPFGRWVTAIGLCLIGFIMSYTTHGPWDIPDNTRPPTSILSSQDAELSADPWNGR